jgi:hypothetical protein
MNITQVMALAWDITIKDEYRSIYPYHDTHPEREGGCGLIIECEKYLDLLTALKDSEIDADHVESYQVLQSDGEDWGCTNPPSPVRFMSDT